MSGIGKSFLLILIVLLAVSSLIIVKPACAQSIPTPSAPEFSVTYIESSYSVNTTNTDTGTTVTHTYANNTVQIVILNQAFDANALENGTALSLTYNVQEEGHFSSGNDWGTISNWVSASNSEYTVISYDVTLYNGSYSPIWNTGQAEVTAGGQVDFQVEATIGYWIRVPSPYSLYGAEDFTGESSGWSNTQTIAITNGSTSTSITASSSLNPTPTPSSLNSTSTPTPTSTPNVPEFPTLIILPLFAVATLQLIKLTRKIPKRH